MAKTVKKTKPAPAKKAVTAKKSPATKGKTVKTKKVAAKPAAKKTAKAIPKAKIAPKAKAKVTPKSQAKSKISAKAKPAAAKKIVKPAPKPVSKSKATPKVKVAAKKTVSKPVIAKTKVAAKPAKAVIESKKTPVVVKTPVVKTVAPKKEPKAAKEVKTAEPARPTRPMKDLPRKKIPMRPIPSNEVSFDMPAPKKNQELLISKDDKLKLKRALLNKCIEIQKNNVTRSKKAMEDAQESANQEKGNSEDQSDSFRENMQATRDMYARQVHEGVNTLALLNRIVVQEHEWVKFGSVIFTDYQNYFISSGLGEIKINELSFITVSTLSPLFQILASKKKGEQFMFLDRMYRVVDVF
ncbi:MAG: hypothetical protein JWM14_279 [Chitinophagaceae bacterium]|nr:hypothetical protein [Chitinophagaceae bacterium]